MHIPTLVVDYHDPVPRSLSIVTLGMTPIAFFLFLLSRTFLFFSPIIASRRLTHIIYSP